jgi:hypothetical protein
MVKSATEFARIALVNNGLSIPSTQLFRHPEHVQGDVDLVER